MADRKTKPAAAAPPPPATPQAKKQRPRLLQEDVPGYSLDQALRVARSIADEYNAKPTRPVNVAGAMGMTHTSGPFRAISGASVAYGLTSGAAQAPEIGITPLGLRIVRSTMDGDDVAAKREALLRPKVVGDFLRNYDGGTLPSDAIAKNVLLTMGVPAERVQGVLEMIIEAAQAVSFIRDWGNGKRTVDLAGPLPASGPFPEREAQPVSSASIPARPAAAVAPAQASVSVGAGIHINIEIHNAADASSETIEDIFRNMRRYVLSGDGQADDGAPEAG